MIGTTVSADAASLPVLERVAVLEANRDNDVRRISKLESAIDQIRVAGWVIAGTFLLDTVKDWAK
jgi:hypothetical protein